MNFTWISIIAEATIAVAFCVTTIILNSKTKKMKKEMEEKSHHSRVEDLKGELIKK